MKITLKEWLAQNGYSTADEALAEDREMDAAWPAMCSDGCEVEPDGQRAVSASGARNDLTGGEPCR